jgi:hypothetical protein
MTGGESGFEIARAWVSVTPDVSDFEQALQEELGGVVVAVTVTPDTADFQAALDEEVGGTVVTVPVTPDATDFDASLDEQIGTPTATVTVDADTTTATDQVDELVTAIDGDTATVTVDADTVTAQDQVDQFLAGVDKDVATLPVVADLEDEGLNGKLAAAGENAVTVPVAPDVAGFQDALDEALAGMTATVAVVPDTADFEQALDEQVGGITETVTVTPDAADFQEQLDEQIGHLAVLTGIGDQIAAALEGALAGATATVAVAPDVSGFAEQLDELTAGMTVTIRVLPDVADFEQSLQEETGGIVVSVPVEPDMADFQEQVNEEIGSPTATVLVDADTGPAQEQIAGLTAETGTLGTEAAAAAADIDAIGAAISSAGEATGLEQTVTELGAVETAAASAGEELATLRQLTSDSFGSVDYSALTAGLNGVATAEDQAAADAQTLQADLAELRTEMADLEAEAVTLDNQFLAFAASGTAGEEALTTLGAQMEDLRNSMAGSAAEMDTFAAALASGNADISTADATLGEFAANIRASESALGEASGAVGTEAASFLTMQEAAQRLGVSVEELPAAFEAMDATLTANAAASAASIAALNGEAAAVDGLDASVAALDFSKLASFIPMAELLSPEVAVLIAATAAVGGLGYAAVTLGNQSDTAAQGVDRITSSLTQQDQATGYNIAGYQELATQLGSTSNVMDTTASSASKLNAEFAGPSTASYAAQLSTVNSVMTTTAQTTTNAAGTQVALAATLNTTNEGFEQGHDGIAVYGDAIADVNTKAQQAQSAADNLSSHLGTLESKYSLTQVQAEALATAAGVSATQLTGSGSAAQNAMSKIETYANSNEAAAGPVNALSNDMATFGNSALTASSRVTALDNAYGLLAGNFVSAEQATLTVSQDFLTIASNAEQAGAKMTGTNAASITLQQSFYSTIPAIEQAANAMAQSGDSTSQVTTYINDQIAKLSGLTGGSQQAQTAVQGLKLLEDNLKTSTDNVNTSATTAAGTLENQFSAQLISAGVNAQTAQTDVAQLTNAIQNNGTQSTAYQSARQQMIKDLENAGLTAQQATVLVNGLTTSITSIPASKNVALTETATGTWSIQEALTGTTGVGGILPTPTGGATGGLITGGSGLPRADDIPALLSHKEYVIQAPAVEKYGTGLFDSLNSMQAAVSPHHFAAGGYVSSYSGTSPADLGTWLTGAYNGNNAAFTSALEASLPPPPGYAGGGYVDGRHAWDAGAAGHAYGKQAASWGMLNDLLERSGWGGGAARPGGGGGNPVVVNFNGVSRFPDPEQIQAIQLAISAAVGVS